MKNYYEILGIELGNRKPSEVSNQEIIAKVTEWTPSLNKIERTDKNFAEMQKVMNAMTVLMGMDSKISRKEYDEKLEKQLTGVNTSGKVSNINWKSIVASGLTLVIGIAIGSCVNTSEKQIPDETEEIIPTITEEKEEVSFGLTAENFESEANKVYSELTNKGVALPLENVKSMLIVLNFDSFSEEDLDEILSNNVVSDINVIISEARSALSKILFNGPQGAVVLNYKNAISPYIYDEYSRVIINNIEDSLEEYLQTGNSKVERAEILNQVYAKYLGHSNFTVEGEVYNVANVGSGAHFAGSILITTGVKAAASGLLFNSDNTVELSVEQYTEKELNALDDSLIPVMNELEKAEIEIENVCGKTNTK